MMRIYFFFLQDVAERMVRVYMKVRVFSASLQGAWLFKTDILYSVFLRGSGILRETYIFALINVHII